MDECLFQSADIKIFRLIQFLFLIAGELMSWEVISCWVELHPGLASWVQAVGAIGVLIVAIVFPILHQRYLEKRARANSSRALRDILLILDDSVSVLLSALLAKGTAIKGLREKYTNYTLLGEAENLCSVADALVRFDVSGVSSDITGHIIRCRALAAYCVRVESEYISYKSLSVSDAELKSVGKYAVNGSVVDYLRLSSGFIKDALDALENS